MKRKRILLATFFCHKEISIAYNCKRNPYIWNFNIFLFLILFYFVVELYFIFSIFCVCWYYFFDYFFVFCVWFLSQISNNLKLQKEMDHRAREDPLQNKTYYKKWAPELLVKFPLHHSLTSVTVISLRRVRNENEQQQNDRNKKKIFHGISFIYLCYFKRPPYNLHY